MPDQDGSKSQIRDWKILLVLTLIEVLKQCPIEMEKNLTFFGKCPYQGHCFKTMSWNNALTEGHCFKTIKS